MVEDGANALHDWTVLADEAALVFGICENIFEFWHFEDVVVAAESPLADLFQVEELEIGCPGCGHAAPFLLFDNLAGEVF